MIGLVLAVRGLTFWLPSSGALAERLRGGLMALPLTQVHLEKLATRTTRKWTEMVPLPWLLMGCACAFPELF